MVTRRYEDSGETYTGKDLGDIAVNLTGAAIRPFFAVDLLFDTPQYYWTGLGDLTFGGATYGGAGNLLGISEIPETSEVKAENATITLSGINGSLLSTALQTQYHGRLAKIKFGVTALDQEFLLLEDGSYLLLEDGALLSISAGDATAMVDIFIGYMDQMVIDEGPDDCTITLSIESKLIDLERPRPIRYTTESQKLRFPNKSPDKAFEFINDLQNKPLMWGRGVRICGAGGGFF